MSKLPSPSMIVACVALLVGLSGTGYAAFKLPRNSVTTAHVRDGTLLVRDFRTGQLGPAGATARWVEVYANGTIAAQSGGITVRRVGNGYYVVNFGVEVGGKAILASSARTGDDRSGRGVVAAGPCTTSSDAGDNCATGNDPRFVGVYTFNGPGSEPENHSFYVALIG
jgi:hypothetical protein